MQQKFKQYFFITAIGILMHVFVQLKT